MQRPGNSNPRRNVLTSVSGADEVIIRDATDGVDKRATVTSLLAGVPAPTITQDFAGLEFTTDAVSVISVIGTYVKAAGTTVLTGSSAGMNDGAVNNRLVYTGSMRHFHIVLQASVVDAGVNQDISVALYKWDASAGTGSILTHSEAHNTIPNNAVAQITSHADTMLDTDDYIELHIANNTSTGNVTVAYGYMFGVSMVGVD